MATRRSISDRGFQYAEGRTDVPNAEAGLRRAIIALGARRRAVDEQAASCDDLLAGLQIAVDLHQIAIGKAGLDLAQFDRLVLVRNPDPDLIALIDQRLLGDAD